MAAFFSAQTPNLATDTNELAQRLGYMETLLKHYVGDISLDLENLQRLSESLNSECLTQTARGAQSISRGSDFAGIEEERFTVLPLGNNAIRKFILWYNEWRLFYSNVCYRLLRRVLALELLNEN